MTIETPTATATVGPELPVFRPAASATVPATPKTSALSCASSLIEPAELMTCFVPPLLVIALVVRLSTRLTAAEPAPASAPVAPVPRAAEAATPTPSAETLTCSSARSVMSPVASTVESSMMAVTVVSTSLIAMPTPMASAAVLLFGLVEAA